VAGRQEGEPERSGIGGVERQCLDPCDSTANVAATRVLWGHRDGDLRVDGTNVGDVRREDGCVFPVGVRDARLVGRLGSEGVDGTGVSDVVSVATQRRDALHRHVRVGEDPYRSQSAGPSGSSPFASPSRSRSTAARRSRVHSSPARRDRSA
jgi:hypothetical protein